MKFLLPLMLAVGFLLGLPGIVFARGLRIWSYQEMLDKSDLVVIATPTAINDTKERPEPLCGSGRLTKYPKVGVRSSHQPWAEGSNTVGVSIRTTTRPSGPCGFLRLPASSGAG